MTKKAFFFVSCWVFLTQISFAQSTNIPLNKDTYHLIDRLEILSGQLPDTYHSAVKPYARKSIGQFTDSIQHQNLTSSRQDVFNLEYLRNDNWEWVDSSTNVGKHPLWNTFYKNKSDFLYGADKEEAIRFHISPV